MRANSGGSRGLRSRGRRLLPRGTQRARRTRREDTRALLFCRERRAPAPGGRRSAGSSWHQQLDSSISPGTEIQDLVFSFVVFVSFEFIVRAAVGRVTATGGGPEASRAQPRAAAADCGHGAAGYYHEGHKGHEEHEERTPGSVVCREGRAPAPGGRRPAGISSWLPAGSVN